MLFDAGHQFGESVNAFSHHILVVWVEEVSHRHIFLMVINQHIVGMYTDVIGPTAQVLVVHITLKTGTVTVTVY